MKESQLIDSRLLAQARSLLKQTVPRLASLDLYNASGEDEWIFSTSLAITDAPIAKPQKVMHRDDLSEVLLTGKQIIRLSHGIAVVRNLDEIGSGLAPLTTAEVDAVECVSNLLITSSDCELSQDKRGVDHLTSLPDRQAWEQEFFRRQNGDLAMAMLDINDFKIINDSLGHATGDRILQNLASTLRRFMTTDMMAARIGGDEFMVMSWGTNFEALGTVMEEFVAEFETETIPMIFGEHHRTVGIAVGVANNNQVTSQQLWEAADDASYAAKNDCDSRSVVISWDQDCAAINLRRERREIANKVQSFIAGERSCGQLAIFAQPITTQATVNGIKSLEILSRWIDKDAQPHSPAVFMEALADFKLEGVLDKWVLQESFRWVSTQSEQFRINVNISPQFLISRQILPVVKELLATYENLDPRRVTFEITETTALSDPEAVVSVCEQLQDLGFGLGIDDYGGGWHSLGDFRNAPISELKIDGSWIREVLTDELAQEIVGSIVRTAKLLNLVTIAEFVETQEQYELLKGMGVDYFQGWLMSKAEPVQYWSQTIDPDDFIPVDEGELASVIPLRKAA